MDAGRRISSTLVFALCALSLGGCANLGAVVYYVGVNRPDYRPVSRRLAREQLADLVADCVDWESDSVMI